MFISLNINDCGVKIDYRYFRTAEPNISMGKY